jgi:hypothetical protein
MNELRYAVQRVDFYLIELARMEQELKGHTTASDSATLYLGDIASTLFAETTVEAVTR